jgi:hypothetical protein
MEKKLYYDENNSRIVNENEIIRKVLLKVTNVLCNSFRSGVHFTCKHQSKNLTMLHF